jgi:hypothetical protein
VTSSHEVHGLIVEVSADVEPVGDAVRDRLRRFPAGARGEALVRFDYRRVAEDEPHAVERPHGPSRPVYDPPAGEILHFPAQDTLLIDYADRVRVVCDIAARHVTISVRPSEIGNLWLQSRPMFTLPLLETAKRHGLFGLHAAAASRGGRGLLLPGTSGSGKSTLTIALARGGYDMLGDDLVFLRGDSEELDALAFTDDIDVTESTAALFPSLRSELGGPPDPGWPKRAVAPDDDLGASVVTSCRPAALVFPTVGAADRSSLEPLNPAEALLRLAPDVLMTDPAAAQAHLDVLGRLVRGCTCWRLETGRDLDAVPGLLAPLLDT